MDGLSPCPYCGEPLKDRPAQCFRCETDLRAWWVFERSAEHIHSGLQASIPSEDRKTSGKKVSLLLVFGISMFSLALGLVIPQVFKKNTVPFQPLPPPVENKAEIQKIRYIVQPGDSLWRISSAFTGEGNRWKQLWPDLVPIANRLQPGMILEIPVTGVDQEKYLTRNTRKETSPLQR
jgi:hypothetical protein